MAETTNTNDFSKVKVGDKLWARLANYDGFVSVTHIYPATENPIRIQREDGYCNSFSFKGEYKCGTGIQCLFFGKPEIIAPPEPKRMVKKIATFYKFWYKLKGASQPCLCVRDNMDALCYIRNDLVNIEHVILSDIWTDTFEFEEEE